MYHTYSGNGTVGAAIWDIDTEPGRYRTEGYIPASTDQGKSFGTIPAWDSKECNQIGRGRMTAGQGVVAVTYTARTGPASENATCPCTVFVLSRDRGKTFAYRVITLPASAPPPEGRGAESPVAAGGRGRGGPGGGRGGIAGLAADPSKAGRFALMIGDSIEYRVQLSEDFGATWSPFVTAGQTPNARRLTKPWMEYSPKGILALMWRAIYADGTYDIWSSISRDGGKHFSSSSRISHPVSPASVPARNAGMFGDDLQNLAIDDENVSHGVGRFARRVAGGVVRSHAASWISAVRRKWITGLIELAVPRMRWKTENAQCAHRR